MTTTTSVLTGSVIQINELGLNNFHENAVLFFSQNYHEDWDYSEKENEHENIFSIFNLHGFKIADIEIEIVENEVTFFRKDIDESTWDQYKLLHFLIKDGDKKLLDNIGLNFDNNKIVIVDDEAESSDEFVLHESYGAYGALDFLVNNNLIK